MRKSKAMKKFETEAFTTKVAEPLTKKKLQERAVFQATRQLVRLDYESKTEIILQAFLQEMQAYITGRTGGTFTDEPQITPPPSYGILRYAVDGAIHHLDKIQNGDPTKPEDFERFSCLIREYVEIRRSDDEKSRQREQKKLNKLAV